MKNKEYWKFILSKAFRTGLQSAISLYLANSSGIIDANMIELIGGVFEFGIVCPSEWLRTI